MVFQIAVLKDDVSTGGSCDVVLVWVGSWIELLLSNSLCLELLGVWAGTDVGFVFRLVLGADRKYCVITDWDEGSEVVEVVLVSFLALA